MTDEAKFKLGDRVIVPDPKVVNPLGGGKSAAHGPGKVVSIDRVKHSWMIDVKLDSGEIRTVGQLFLKKEGDQHA